ncbi:MAG TPA: sigma-54 dependent transcriptional regulator [Thermoanaerobaculia bacterium]|nr:sigma-54 dependent transcriptional regulator [Thermoanaerobaculia bacterium]
MTSVLIVEDDEKIRASLLLQLREEGLSPQAMACAEEAQAQLIDAARPLPDLLLLDVRLRQMSGVDLIRELAPRRRLPPTVIISGEASISETVEALRLGVHDFIEKPFSRERLLRSIANTLEHAALKRQVIALESRFDEGTVILGASPAAAQLRAVIARAAPTSGRVLITGASGTGKELVASTLHRQSARRDGPFIKINCAAIPAHLVEDELFGHARGAFTDAKSAKPGLFEEADGGTLFLDEIGDMEVGLQARLLRVLEDGGVRRIGETRDRQVDVRVFAATHHDLEARVAAGQFRQDLYFRLAHLPIEVPPLSARREDIRQLFAHFVELFSRQNRLRRRQIDEAVYPALESYAWPGNIRELRNLCERLVVFGGDPLTLDQLPSALFQPARSPQTGIVRLGETYPILPLKDFKAACERDYLDAVLQRTDWNFSAAARLLRIQRTYLHQKAAALGVERPARPRHKEAPDPKP